MFDLMFCAWGALFNFYVQYGADKGSAAMQGMTENIFILQGLENWFPAQLHPNYLKKFSRQYRRCALAEHGLCYLCKEKIEEPTRD